jgi:hypothetical protein
MKKLIVTTAVACVAAGAFAQGSITAVQSMFANDGITTPGPGALGTGATTWFTGNVTVSLYYASLGSLSSAQINALNANDGVSAPAQLAALSADGFKLDSATTLATTGATAGAIPFAVSDGFFTASDPNQINLLTAPSSSNEWIAMEVTGPGGAVGILAFEQNTGGNPYAIPAGVVTDMTTDPAGINFVLSPVPEPTTMALAALGGAAMLLIRRKK